MQDISTYHAVKSRFRNSTIQWWEQNQDQLRDDGKETNNPFVDLGGVVSYIDPEPLVFPTEEKFWEYVKDPMYEIEEGGMCLAILVEENISDPATPRDKQSIRIDIFAEAQRGKTPSAGGAGVTATA